MATDQNGLDSLRSTLRTDGYLMDIAHEGDRVAVSISAMPGICGDCLVSKPIMLSMLEPVLGVSASSIDLSYPEPEDDK